jgi:hypothetical protein
MRRWIPALLALSGCDGIEWGYGSPEVGTYAVAIGAVPLPDGAWDAEEVELEIDVGDLVLEGAGPSADLSVAAFVEFGFEPYASLDAVGFDLEQGTYDDVLCAVALRADDSDAIDFRVEREDTKLELSVDALDLQFAVGRFEVGEEPSFGTILFDPQAWIEGLGLTALVGERRIEPGSPQYEELVALIIDTTTFTAGLPPAPTPTDDTTDDDDRGDR